MNDMTTTYRTHIIQLSNKDRDIIFDIYCDAEEDSNPSYSYNEDIVDLVKSNKFNSHGFTIPDVAKIAVDLNSMDFCGQLNEDEIILLKTLNNELDSIFQTLGEFEFKENVFLDDTFKKRISFILTDYDISNPDIVGIKPTQTATLLEKNDLTMNEARILTTEMYRWSRVVYEGMEDRYTYTSLFEEINRIRSHYEETFNYFSEEALEFKEPQKKNIKLDSISL